MKETHSEASLPASEKHRIEKKQKNAQTRYMKLIQSAYSRP